MTNHFLISKLIKESFISHGSLFRETHFTAIKT